MPNVNETAGDNEFAAKLQQARDGFAALTWAAQNGSLEEMTADFGESIDERVLGQIMMEMLEDPEGLRPSVKQKLVLVAAHMGPDWIDNLRKAVAFMDKVESFQ